MEIFNLNEMFGSLKQDEKSDIQIKKVTNGAVAVFVAELKAGKKLAAHYHNEGDEIYQIMEGEGMIEIGELSASGVIWKRSCDVKAGDVFEVAPKMIHRLSNNSANNLRLIFFTPSTHLGENRVFI